MTHRKSVRTGLALLLMTVAIFTMLATPASAGPRVNCAANGFVDITGETGAWNWSFRGSGLCLDSLQGNYLVALAGSGSSLTLGLCDGLLVTGLNLDVSLILTNLRTGAVTVVEEVWRAPVSTFPVATPFLIPGRQGTGAILTRVLLNCPPDGNNIATFAFTTQT